MLAKEADRRVPAVTKALKKLEHSHEPDPSAIEAMRVEVHGLKGAAMVIGEAHLGRLAERAEKLLAARIEPGTIDAGLNGRLTAAVVAFHEGAHAAADGQPEPPSVAQALGALRA